MHTIHIYQKVAISKKSFEEYYEGNSYCDDVSLTC
jgi:hypothetical protein